MADLNRDDVSIKVTIKEETSEGQFNDSLYLPLAEFEALTDEEVDALKTERVNKWVDFVVTQKNIVPAEPTEEELIEQKANLEAELAQINDSLVAIAEPVEEEIK